MDTNEENLTLHQWLECYEFISKREFEDLPQYKQNNYRDEYEMWKKGISQYN